VTVGNWLAFTWTIGYAISRHRAAPERRTCVERARPSTHVRVGVRCDPRFGRERSTSTKNLDLRIWIDPEQGTQTQEVLVNLSRLHGAPSFSVTENLIAHTVALSAWGKTSRVHTQLKANSWHLIDLAVAPPPIPQHPRSAAIGSVRRCPGLRSQAAKSP
jgi:hypothetical protein